MDCTFTQAVFGVGTLIVSVCALGTLLCVMGYYRSKIRALRALCTAIREELGTNWRFPEMGQEVLTEYNRLIEGK